jgi:hypothetical protein
MFVSNEIQIAKKRYAEKETKRQSLQDTDFRWKRSNRLSLYDNSRREQLIKCGCHTSGRRFINLSPSSLDIPPEIKLLDERKELYEGKP